MPGVRTSSAALGGFTTRPPWRCRQRTRRTRMRCFTRSTASTEPAKVAICTIGIRRIRGLRRRRGKTETRNRGSRSLNFRPEFREENDSEPDAKYAEDAELGEDSGHHGRAHRRHSIVGTVRFRYQIDQQPKGGDGGREAEQQGGHPCPKPPYR